MWLLQWAARPLLLRWGLPSSCFHPVFDRSFRTWRRTRTRRRAKGKMTRKPIQKRTWLRMQPAAPRPMLSGARCLEGSRSYLVPVQPRAHFAAFCATSLLVKVSARRLTETRKSSTCWAFPCQRSAGGMSQTYDVKVDCNVAAGLRRISTTSTNWRQSRCFSVRSF